MSDIKRRVDEWAQHNNPTQVHVDPAILNVLRSMDAKISFLYQHIGEQDETIAALEKRIAKLDGGEQ